jgi:hypothetical protein
MPPKRPLVSDDESEYDDLDELLSDNEDDKPTGIAALLKGSLSIPRHTSTSVEHINSESGRAAGGAAKGSTEWARR